MSTSKDDRSVVRGFRLPAQILEKLDALAKQTGRSRSSMLIYLIALAELTHLPDIQLRTEQPSPTKAP